MFYYRGFVYILQQNLTVILRMEDRATRTALNSAPYIFHHLLTKTYRQLSWHLKNGGNLFLEKQQKCLLSHFIHIWPHRNHACLTSSEWDVRLLAVEPTALACSFTLQTLPKSRMTRDIQHLNSSRALNNMYWHAARPWLCLKPHELDSILNVPTWCQKTLFM